MPYGSYVNKVRERTCPYCGIKHPLDWFIRETKKNEKEVKRNDSIG